jgi:hypothetical protein
MNMLHDLIEHHQNRREHNKDLRKWLEFLYSLQRADAGCGQAVTEPWTTSSMEAKPES